MLDYDLFCRFSRNYNFHFVDQVLATYRIHSESKTSSVTDAQRLEQAVQVSRRYWGSPISPQRWRIQWLYVRHRFGRRRRGVALLQRGRESWRQGRYPVGLALATAGALLAPEVVGDVAVARAAVAGSAKAGGDARPIGERADPGVAGLRGAARRWLGGSSVGVRNRGRAGARVVRALSEHGGIRDADGARVDVRA
ncbi:MAG: hypothetical protein FJW27_01235 [Acidimicrobiia bacterium]|nr:hypothetical protein [Acidimicrobiia bacterium]